MEIVENKKEKEKYIKVIIGNSETGFRGIKSPTKSIRLVDTTVDDVYNILIEALKNNIKKKKEKK